MLIRRMHNRADCLPLGPSPAGDWHTRWPEMNTLPKTMGLVMRPEHWLYRPWVQLKDFILLLSNSTVLVLILQLNKWNNPFYRHVSRGFSSVGFGNFPPANGETTAVLVSPGLWALNGNSLVAASSNVFTQLLVGLAAGASSPAGCKKTTRGSLFTIKL